MTELAFDTETRGLNWFEPDEQAFLASWADADTEGHGVLLDGVDTNHFLDRLSLSEVVIAHNLSFDVHQTRATIGFDLVQHADDEGAELHDTDLMSRILHPEGQRKGERGGHGLKNLAEVYLRADAKQAEDHIKEMGKQIGLRTLKKKGAYYEVWRAFPEVMEKYARDDARFTFDLYKQFRPKLEVDPARWELYLIEMEVCRILIRAEAKGTQVDPKVVARLKQKWDALEQELRGRLEQELGDGLTHEDFAGSYDEDTDPTTGAALRDALVGVGVPLHRTTPKGHLATNRFALQEFIETHPVVRTLFDWRRAYRFQGTYLSPLVGRDTVHPSFMQAEAWTGRMSCRRPNMQNLPKRGETEDGDSEAKEMRSVFVARPGHALVVTDYEGIEAKLLAYYLGPAGEPYRKMLREGLDTHAWMASVIWGGTPEDYAKGTPGRPKRDRAKAVLFAISYGAGAPRVSDMLGCSKSEAKQIIDTIKSSIPGFKKLQYRIRKKIESVGHVNTYFGRKQVVQPEKAYVGLSAVIQGTAADILKRGMVEVQRRFDEADIGAQILLLVHDETTSEVPEEHAEQALRLQEEGMLAALPDLDPPLLVESSIVRSYGDA